MARGARRATTNPAGREAGYSLVALIVAINVMLVMMAVAVPAWKYVIKDDKEEELLFRGQQIAKALDAYQKKRGGAKPASLEGLVKEKFLRRAYKDPMTPDGKWRLVRPGQPGAPGGPPIQMAGPSPSPSPLPGSMSADTKEFGPIAGVVSRSSEKSLRILNGQERYDRWNFTPGMPFVIGRQTGVVKQPGFVPTPEQK
jgi:type II secretory pathway pseudopilin PulG